MIHELYDAHSLPAHVSHSGLGVVKADVDMWSGAIFAITFLVSGSHGTDLGALADKRAASLWRCAPDLLGDHLLLRRLGHESLGAARRSIYSRLIRGSVACAACDHLCRISETQTRFLLGALCRAV